MVLPSRGTLRSQRIRTCKQQTKCVRSCKGRRSSCQSLIRAPQEMQDVMHTWQAHCLLAGLLRSLTSHLLALEEGIREILDGLFRLLGSRCCSRRCCHLAGHGPGADEPVASEHRGCLLHLLSVDEVLQRLGPDNRTFILSAVEKHISMQLHTMYLPRCGSQALTKATDASDASYCVSCLRQSQC
jgi:hypothetical protein